MTCDVQTRKVLDISWGLKNPCRHPPRRSNRYVKYETDPATPERPYDIIKASFLVCGKFCDGVVGDVVLIGGSWYRVNNMGYAQVADQTFVSAERMSVPCNNRIDASLYYYLPSKPCNGHNPKLITSFQIGVVDAPISKQLRDDNWSPQVSTRIYPFDQSKATLFETLVDKHALFKTKTGRTYEVVEVGDVCTPQRLVYASVKKAIFPEDK